MSGHTDLLERDEAIERLRGWLKPGDTVYAIVRHVSRSGMQRHISVLQIEPVGAREQYVGVAGGDTVTVGSLSYNVALALKVRDARSPYDAVVVNGCGTDMCFEITYNLGRVLWPDGFGCVGEGCPSNDHSNGDRDYTPHCLGYDKDGKPNGIDCELPDCKGAHWHRDGGYALKVRTL